MNYTNGIIHECLLKSKGNSSRPIKYTWGGINISWSLRFHNIQRRYLFSFPPFYCLFSLVREQYNERRNWSQQVSNLLYFFFSSPKGIKKGCIIHLLTFPLTADFEKTFFIKSSPFSFRSFFFFKRVRLSFEFYYKILNNTRCCGVKKNACIMKLRINIWCLF